MRSPSAAAPLSASLIPFHQPTGHESTPIALISSATAFGPIFASEGAPAMTET
jgi:hypothetical protein